MIIDTNVWVTHITCDRGGGQTNLSISKPVLYLLFKKYEVVVTEQLCRQTSERPSRLF